MFNFLRIPGKQDTSEHDEGPVEEIPSFEPLSLSYGVEIECYLEGDEFSKQARESSDPYSPPSSFESSLSKLAYGEVRKTLADAQLPVADPEHKIHAPEANEGWRVVPDMSIDVRQHGDEEYVGNLVPLEIVSRKLAVGVASEKEVRLALDALKGRFTMGVNPSTGLHVHVGDSKRRRLPFLTVRRLAALITGFEHLIAQVHSVSRIKDTVRLTKTISKMKQNFYQPLDLRLEQIWQTNTASRLYQLFAGEKFVAYNFGSLKTYGTVEFRQHEGCLDAERVINWMRFCAGMVEFSHRVTDFEMKVLVERKATSQEFTFADFLEATGSPGLVGHFTPRIRTKYADGFEPPWHEKVIARHAPSKEEMLKLAKKERGPIGPVLNGQFGLKTPFSYVRPDLADVMGSASDITDGKGMSIESVWSKGLQAMRKDFQGGFDAAESYELKRREARMGQRPARQALRSDWESGTMPDDEYIWRRMQLSNELPGGATGLSRPSGGESASPSPTGNFPAVHETLTRELAADRPGGHPRDSRANVDFSGSPPSRGRTWFDF